MSTSLPSYSTVLLVCMVWVVVVERRWHSLRPIPMSQILRFQFRIITVLRAIARMFRWDYTLLEWNINRLCGNLCVTLVFSNRLGVSVQETDSASDLTHYPARWVMQNGQVWLCHMSFGIFGFKKLVSLRVASSFGPLRVLEWIFIWDWLLHPTRHSVCSGRSRVGHVCHLNIRLVLSHVGMWFYRGMN